jgi:phytoene synthase
MATSEEQVDQQHCASLLHERDRDLWLASLFAPAEARPFVQAVYAFVLEARDIRTRVSQPLLGEMRLRWWADAIHAGGGDARAHPVAGALLAAADRFDLPRDELVGLVEAHIFDLYDDAMPDMAALENYCRLTATNPMLWISRMLGGTVEPVFLSAGLALGLTRALRDPSPAFLPASLCADPGSAMARGEARRALAASAGDAFETARAAARPPVVGAAALLPAAMVPLYLELMARKDYDDASIVAAPSALRRQWRLWRAARGVGL